MRLAGLLLVVLAGVAASVAPARADVSFSRDIAPIILKRCTGCHGERTNLGGFRAHTFQSLMKPGASGKPSIVPGKPGQSHLFALITATSEATRMPMSDDALSVSDIDLIRKWITAGARFDGADPTANLKSLIGPRQYPAAPAVYRSAVPVMALAFTPDGKTLAVGGYHEVTLWDAATGRLVRRIQHLPQRIQALAFSRNGAQLLLGGGTPGEYGEADLVDMTTGLRSRVLDTFNDIVLAAAFSMDESRVVAGSADSTVRAFDTTSGKRLWSSKVHSDWVTSVSFSFDGRFVASGSRDMTVKIYDATTGELYTTYNGHNRQIGQYKTQNPVYAVQFARDSLTGCSAGGGRWIQLWDPIKTKAEAGDAGDTEERFAKENHTRYIEHGFSHDVFALVVRDGQIFAASADGDLKQFDMATLKLVRSYVGGSDWLYALDYNSGTAKIAAGSYTGEIHIWDTRTGDVLLSFFARPGQKTAMTALMPSPR